ncbi:MAG TPA: ribonuclease D [Alphaproteobacteria bacterium]|nr:ribonuclease D [Alphaproteobacteria bacterium]
MKIHYHRGDIPSDLKFSHSVAIDTEAMGLYIPRDRLTLVQLSAGDGECHLVHFPLNSSYEAPHLRALLNDKTLEKIYHFARFDYAILKYYLKVDASPLFCTKIASRLSRTFSDKHGLKDICKQLLSVDISKNEQTSDWGSDKLSDKQMEYAASDVLYLHRLKAALQELLKREGRESIAKACFEFIPARCELDIQGWNEVDIFQH